VVVEHTFVTTMEARDALRAAMELLSSRGFVPVFEQAFAVGEANNFTTLEMRRGKAKAVKAKNVVQLPQLAHLQYDRGRVSVALSIEPNHTWGGGGIGTAGFGIDTTAPTGSPKKMKLHTQLLSAQAVALEQRLAQQCAAESCMAQWDQAEAACVDAARRRRRRSLIIVMVFVLFVVGLFVLVVGNEMKWFR
jgi:hypothetical protein